MSIRWKCAVLELLLLLCMGHSIHAQELTNGWLDLRNTALSGEIISLKGEWGFYPNRLLPPHTINRYPKSIALFPSLWTKQDSMQKATYRLDIVLPENLKGRPLTLAVPPVFSSYSLWINGTLAGANGTPGETAATTIPHAQPALYPFTSPTDTVELVVHIANFYHSPGGGDHTIYLGESDRLEEKKALTKVTDYILFATLFIIAVVSLWLYFARKTNRTPFLYLAFFVLVWMIRSACSNEYRLLEWMQVSWSTLIRLEYLGIYLSTIMALLFLSSLFPRDFDNKLLRLFFICTCILFSFFTLVTAPIIFTRYLRLYVGVSTCLIVYVIFIICKAFVYERAGATIMLITILLGALTFGYVILDYIDFLEVNVLAYNLSFMVLFSLLTYSMSVRLSRMNKLDEIETLTLDHFFKDRG